MAHIPAGASLRCALAFAALTFLPSCAQDRASPSDEAEAAMRSQFASDIQLVIDAPTVRRNEPGGDWYYLCGYVTLTTPPGYPPDLAIRHPRQRFITTMRTDGTSRGVTGTDNGGDVAADALASFDAAWQTKCGR